MASDRVPGFLTRPEASKIYNRSQRALERDLDIALSLSDHKLLAHWKLVTKDNLVRAAHDLTTDIVKELQADGMVPTWFVEERYLEQEYGRKDSSKSPQSASERPHTHAPSAKRSGKRHRQTVPEPNDPLPDDVRFLKDRIYALEQERRQDKARQDELLGKVFDQLRVKDEQIRKWDEVTQALIKGLATGKLTPTLLPAVSETEQEDMRSQSSLMDAVATARPTASRSKTSQRTGQQKPRRNRKNSHQKHTTFFSLKTPTLKKLLGLAKR